MRVSEIDKNTKIYQLLRKIVSGSLQILIVTKVELQKAKARQKARSIKVIHVEGDNMTIQKWNAYKHLKLPKIRHWRISQPNRNLKTFRANSWAKSDSGDLGPKELLEKETCEA